MGNPKQRSDNGKRIQRKIVTIILPRRDEFIYFNEQYYQVINVVHMMNKLQDIFIIVDEFTKDPSKETGSVSIS